MQGAYTSLGQRFFHQWLRWWVWLVSLGVGFHGGELLMLASRHALETGILVFVTGVAGYVFFGIPIAALIALVPTLLPNLKLLSTSLLGGIMRVLIIGLLLGVATVYSNPSMFGSAAAQTSPAPRTATTDDRGTCLAAYHNGHYSAAMPACESLALVYAPRLASVMHGNDMHAMLTDCWDMLRITYVMAFGYKQNGEPENARQAALHSVGWGIFSLGAMESLDPHHRNAQYTAMTAELGEDLRALDAAFPGVVAEERKAVNESSSH